MTDTGDTTPRGPFGYFFANAPAGSPLSYQALLTRRKIAQELASRRSPFPKNAGEGLTYLGEQLGNVIRMNDLDAQERQQAALENRVRSGFPGYDDLETAARNRPDAAAPATTTEPKIYSQGDYNPLDAQTDQPAPTGAGATVGDTSAVLRGVDPRLVASVTAGAKYLPDGYTVRPTSGLRPGDSGYHGRGLATDWQIIDPAGKAVPNTGSDPTGVYTTLARGAYTHAQQNYPDVAARMGWGGAFDKRKGGGTGIADPMHIDLGGDRGNLIPGNRLRTLGPFPDRRSGLPDDPRDLIASAITPPPTRVAALTGGGSPTATDAGGGGIIPPDAGGPARTDAQTPLPAIAQADQPNPPIVSDIGRMPTFTGPGSMAQMPPADFAPAGPGAVPPPQPATTGAALPPATTGAALPPPPAPPAAPAEPPVLGPALPPPSSIQPAPRGPTMSPADIYRESVLSPGAVVAPHPGAPPDAPRPPLPTPGMQKLLEAMGSPYLSPELKDVAKSRYQLLYERQKQDYEQKINEYQFRRGKYDTDLSQHEKSVRELPLEEAKLQKQRLEMARSITRDPLELSQLSRQIQELDQKLAAGVAPKTEVDPRTGRLMMWNQATGRMEDAAPPVRPEDLKLSVEEAKNYNYFVNSHVASTQLGDQKALTGLADWMRNRVPVFGNNWVKPEYRQIKSAADAWIMNTLRSQSGATIRPEETKDYYAIYFPRYGDTPIDIAAKAARRSAQEASLKTSLGPVRPLADQFVAQRETRRADPSIAHGTIQTSPSTGRNRVNIHGYWEDIP